MANRPLGQAQSRVQNRVTVITDKVTGSSNSQDRVHGSMAADNHSLGQEAQSRVQDLIAGANYPEARNSYYLGQNSTGNNIPFGQESHNRIHDLMDFGQDRGRGNPRNQNQDIDSDSPITVQIKTEPELLFGAYNAETNQDLYATINHRGVVKNEADYGGYSEFENLMSLAENPMHT